MEFLYTVHVLQHLDIENPGDPLNIKILPYQYIYQSRNSHDKDRTSVTPSQWVSARKT